MPPVTTRTIGPLHLEDLEPHRFEDLVRQLIYDFRPWSHLEPTGRGGSDDGYDARGWERISTAEPSEEDDPEAIASSDITRLWLIQCKREKTIAPKKLRAYLDGLPQSTDEPIHGIIFAAACDFSKTARDVFRTRTRELGFNEAYLWGKGDIEDQLFQPKNDHLLFAYIGVSLQMRKRSLKTEIRARLATKRKAKKVLGNFRPTLIRDASEDRYPWLAEDKSLPRYVRGRWQVVDIESCKSDGVRIRIKRCFAIIRGDGTWDYAEMMNDAVESGFVDGWVDEPQYEKLRIARDKASEIWNAELEENRAWLEVFTVLPYENILDIDEDGDEFHHHGPHIYTSEWTGNDMPLRSYTHVNLETITRYTPRMADPDEMEKRIMLFERRQADAL